MLIFNTQVTQVNKTFVFNGGMQIPFQRFDVLFGSFFPQDHKYILVEAVKNGHNVNTKLFKVYPSITGVFANQQDGFDSSRHAIRLNLNAGSRLKEAVTDIELHKVEITSPQPVLQQFRDLKTKVINETYTRGQIAALKGTLLKFDESDRTQGVFFISDGTETRVDNIVKNKPSELLFFVPETLADGTYQVEVRSIPHKLKTLRKGRLLIDLTAI